MADEVGPSVLVLTSAQNCSTLSVEGDRPDASDCDTEPLASALCASAARSSTAAPLGGLVLLEDRRLMDAAGSGWALFIG